MSDKKDKADDSVDLGKGKALGDGAKPPADGDLAKAELPADGEISPDATIPGVQPADTLGANAPGETEKGDKQ